MQVIIKVFVAEFILRKISQFQHIPLNIFWRMSVKYENYFLKCSLYKTSKQNSNYKSLIAKAIDGNTLNMKTASPI